MNPKDNPHIYGTRAAEAQRIHDRYQAKRDAQYLPKPNPPARAVPQTNFYRPSNSSPQRSSRGEPVRRSSMSPKTAITIVGLIVGGIAVVFAGSHGVTSTLGLACAFGFSAGPVVALLTKLTKS
jgi:hypothetical protein